MSLKHICPVCSSEIEESDSRCATCGENISHSILEEYVPSWAGDRSAKINETHLNLKQPNPSPNQKRCILVKYRKSRFLYGILAITLGILGIHNFYAGRYKQALLQLLLGPLTFVTAGLCAYLAKLNYFLTMGVIGALLVVVGYSFALMWVIRDIFTVKTDGEGDAFA